MFFNKNLKFLREIRKISQQQMADDLKVNRQTIAQYEIGKIKPTFDSLINIRNYFNVNLDDLIFKDLEKDKKTNNNEKNYFYSNVKYLIEKNYISIYSFVKKHNEFKQNTLQDYLKRNNDSTIYPKLDNILMLAEVFNLSLDDLVYKDLSKNNN